MAARISECGYCGRTEFTGWYSKTAPKDRYGRLPLDYLDSEPVAYCSEEHRDAADKIRARAFREAADAIASLPQDFEKDPGRGDAVERLLHMARAAEGGVSR
jgi:hypothetical protein